mgnify:FL=1
MRALFKRQHSLGASLDLFLKRALRKVLREVRNQISYRRDRNQPTFDTITFGNLFRHFAPLPVQTLQPFHEHLRNVCNHYLAHRFDLLGSGWVQVKHGMHCAGVEGCCYETPPTPQIDTDGRWLKGRINKANLSESQRIWRLISPTYIPIDWHLDFKSGYRWGENRWYRFIPYGHLPGVDVKVPWELARAQHLPQLAWAYALASADEPDFEDPERYSTEFRDQILDFIATNPPRFGVNWYCTMDVAIRIANWLVAYDLFCAYGATFDAGFLAELKRSVFQHGVHIAANLEWHPEWRGNHYLANVVGLLFVSAYLPRSPQTDCWLAFAAQEISFELLAQFNPDGSNFEASTSYHRLSAEMIVYAVALLQGLSPQKQAALHEYQFDLYAFPRPLPPAPLNLETLFSPTHWARLEKMAEFSSHITKPSGHVSQIGDNDSGRFVKLFPCFHAFTTAEARAKYLTLDHYTELPDDALYLDEDVLDHRHLLAAVNGLFGRSDFTESVGSKGYQAETHLVHQLAGQRVLPSYKEPTAPSEAEQVHIGNQWISEITQLSMRYKPRNFEIRVSASDLHVGLVTYGYPDFGLFIYRSPQVYLAIRCGQIGQRGNGGHAHNDQLSIELNIQGVDWITDPGSYVYTPLPIRRNEYRSVQAHFAPHKNKCEPGRLDLGLFRLGDEAQARCLYFGIEGFLGMYNACGSAIYRAVTIESDRIVIQDFADDPDALAALPEHPEIPSRSLMISPKYGARCR